MNDVFNQPAFAEQIEQTARALEANGIKPIIVENREAARSAFFDLVPEGAQVHQGASRTLEELGITVEIEGSGRFHAIRPKLRAMDRQTQSDDMRRMGASPDYMVGSVAAVTEDGRVLAASATGGQLGPYVSGAGKVVWVVGSQKIVRSLEEGFRRIEEYIYPLEDQRTMKAYNIHTYTAKVLLINRERPGRITMIIVKEALGF